MPELFETLTTGGTFKARFNTRDEADKFRSKLATHKHRTEKHLRSVGMEYDHLSLNMIYEDDTGIASFRLIVPAPKPLRTYEILEIESPQLPD
jgi:hypothetical protein